MMFLLESTNSMSTWYIWCSLKPTNSVNTWYIWCSLPWQRAVPRSSSLWTRHVTHHREFEERDGLNKEKKYKATITLGKEIKKDIRTAREAQRIEELKDKLWYDIQNIKKGFQPSNIKIRDKEGKPVPSTRKAETIAEFLEKNTMGKYHESG